MGITDLVKEFERYKKLDNYVLCQVFDDIFDMEIYGCYKYTYQNGDEFIEMLNKWHQDEYTKSRSVNTTAEENFTYLRLYHRIYKAYLDIFVQKTAYIMTHLKSKDSTVLRYILINSTKFNIECTRDLLVALIVITKYNPNEDIKKVIKDKLFIKLPSNQFSPKHLVEDDASGKNFVKEFHKQHNFKEVND